MSGIITVADMEKEYTQCVKHADLGVYTQCVYTNVIGKAMKPYLVGKSLTTLGQF